MIYYYKVSMKGHIAMTDIKEKYESPVFEIVSFSVRDVLTTSPEQNNDVNLPIHFFDPTQP